MQRREFSREFKLEMARLVRARGVSVAQAARDLDVPEEVLRNWLNDLTADPPQSFAGPSQIGAEQLEIDRLRREVAKLKNENGRLQELVADLTLNQEMLQDVIKRKL